MLYVVVAGSAGGGGGGIFTAWFRVVNMRFCWLKLFFLLGFVCVLKTRN